MAASEPPPSRIRITLPVTGMTCANCAAAVERALQRKVIGVSEAVVNLAAESVTVTYDTEVARLENLAAAVARAGYGLVLPRPAEDAADTERAARQRERVVERRAFLVGAVCTVPLLILSMGRDLGVLGTWASAAAADWLLWLLATPVQFYTGATYYLGAVRSLRAGSANMDVLVALGSSVAYSYSVAVLVVPELHGHLQFETSAVIVTLIRLGKLLETRARGRTRDALRKLIALAPQTARRLRPVTAATPLPPTGAATDSAAVAWCEESVPIASLAVGDRVLVRPGERIPADGVVREGASAVDESLITGESLPVDKSTGAVVTGGTINQEGSLQIEVTRVGEATTLGRIVRLVREAQTGKAPIQRLADRISAIFVPVIVGVALAAFVLWWAIGGAFVPAMLRLVAILVVACPCALGLATPTAIMVGSGVGARLGILFRSPTALESVHRLKTLLVDKTGTLTAGRPEVVAWVVAPGSAIPEDELRRLAAAAERASEHPLARAIVTAAGPEAATLPSAVEFAATPGCGVSARILGRRVIAGKPVWLAGQGIDLEVLSAAIAHEQAQGRTVVAVAVDGVAAGLAALADRERSTATAAVAALRRLGVEPIMLTGDNARAAAAVARAVGIDTWVADVPPDRKEAVVREHQRPGRVVGMVGDGLNDAPALARADVGIAVGTGTDIAMDAADVVLVHGDLLGVARAVHLSRAIMRTVRQNLFWAFFYNVLLVPVSAGALHGVAFLPPLVRDFHPILAALAMASSSLTVVLNSLRLGRWRPA